MCNCIDDLRNRLKEKLNGSDDLGSLKPRNAEALDFLIIAHSALMIQTGKFALNIPFTATWKMKNGKRKDTQIPILASHCPFCGAEFEKPKPE